MSMAFSKFFAAMVRLPDKARRINIPVLHQLGELGAQRLAETMRAASIC